MESQKPNLLSRFQWQIVIASIMLTSLALVIILSVFTNVFEELQAHAAFAKILSFVGFALLGGVATLLIIILKTFDPGMKNDRHLENITDLLKKNNDYMLQTTKNTQLSETAKAIASRDIDRQSLREAVFDKLQQQDFFAACEIVDEIAHSSPYKELAETLRKETDKYRNASDEERVNQVLAQIEKLFQTYQWAKAGARIEKLITDFPNSKKAKAARQELVERKQQRKRILLRAWDEAVKRQETDKSLEILKELDLYLTPNEGLALQEAARDVFRTKLHNLGVQFSLAVSEKQWAKAVEIGRQIIRDFPNSRIADEIRQGMSALKQKVHHKQTPS